MPDTIERGPHIHQPCIRRGLVEAEIDGLCSECSRQATDVEPTGQGPDPETAKLER